MTRDEYTYHIEQARQEYRGLVAGTGNPYHQLRNILFRLDTVGADYSALADDKTNDEMHAELQRLANELLPKHYEYHHKGDWPLPPRTASPVAITEGEWKRPDGSAQRVWAMDAVRPTEGRTRH